MAAQHNFDSFSSFDHLPHVEHPAYPPVKVPFLGMFYDGSNFSTYPKSKGWVTELLLWGHLFGKSEADAESFLQSWLFFGALSEVFGTMGIELDQEDFVRSDAQGQMWITTRALRDYITLWACRTRRVPMSDYAAKESRIRSCLATLALFFKRHVSFIGRMKSEGLVGFEIGLSIGILGNALDAATFQLLVEPLPTASGWISNAWPPTDSLRSHYRANGRCACAAARLEGSCKLDTLYYLSLLRQPIAGADHSACNSEQCSAENIDQTTYEPGHMTSCRTCEHIAIDNDAVCSILAKGGIPVVLLDLPSSNDIPSLAVSQAGADTEYIAISHVWMDKMGNTRSNSLPHCLLKYLESLVRRTAQLQGLGLNGKNLGFWMDTLCVPVNEELKVYKKKAIVQMRATYQNANAVLVLDSALQQIRTPQDPEELGLRLTTSGWCRRLWTLQESAFAREVWVAFSDGIANVTQIGGYAADTFALLTGLPGASMAFSNVKRDGWRPFHATRTLAFIQAGHLTDMSVASDGTGVTDVFAWHVSAMRDRNTSKPGDESLCLATLMQLDLKTLLETPEADRMKALYSMLATVPPFLIFFPGRRFDEVGYRWAPRSFLGKSSRDHQNAVIGSPCVRDDRHGVQIAYPKFRLFAHSEYPKSTITPLVCPTTKRVFFRDTFSNTWYMMFTFIGDIVELHGFFNPVLLPELHQPIVVLPHWSSSSQDQYTQQGALVTLQREDLADNALYTKHEAIVQVRELTGQHDAQWANGHWPFLGAYRSRQDLANEDRVIAEAVRVPDDMEFWIG